MIFLLGFPSDSVVKNLPASEGDVGREDPQEKKMATYSNILAGKSHGQRNLVGYSLWGHKESDMTYRLNNNIVISVRQF